MMEDPLADKVFRYERKFVVPYSKEEAEVVIKNNPFIFEEIYYERRINNLYFDSLEMHNYFDNVLGNSDRTKIRVRWYGDTPVAKNPTLELKIRRGLMGTKLSYQLADFSLGGVDLDEMNALFSNASLPEWLGEKLKHQRFALYNTYQRKYFLSACKKFRLTIDFGLEFAGVVQQNPLALFDRRSEPHVIVELKYAKECDAERLTTYFPFRMTKSSKYVAGINLFRGA